KRRAGQPADDQPRLGVERHAERGDQRPHDESQRVLIGTVPKRPRIAGIVHRSALEAVYPRLKRLRLTPPQGVLSSIREDQARSGSGSLLTPPRSAPAPRLPQPASPRLRSRPESRCAAL